MKKIIVLLLLTVMCFLLVACGNKDKEKYVKYDELIQRLEEEKYQVAQAEKEILGTWQTKSGEITLVFNKDGTGSFRNDEIKWKYDTNLSCYIVCDDDGEINGIYSIETDENGALFLSYVGYNLYYQG